MLTFTFRLLHCTQPERVFLCAFRGAACMLFACLIRTCVKVRDLRRSCRMECETGKHLLVDSYQHDAYTNANARVRGSAEAQPRKTHMTRPREKLVPRHETESSGCAWCFSFQAWRRITFQIHSWVQSAQFIVSSGRNSHQHQQAILIQSVYRRETRVQN